MPRFVFAVERMLQGDKSKGAGLIKTHIGTLEFPDINNGDVDSGRFESDVSDAKSFVWSVI